MRVTISGYEVEGSPEEVAALIRAQSNSQIETKAAVADNIIEVEEDERFASEKIAYRALRRRPLSPAQRAVFRKLLDAYPNWVSASELQAATGYNPNQLGGLLGAIGRRLSQTDGFVKDSSLLEWMSDVDSNEYAYRLPKGVRNAVKRIDP